MPPKKFAHGVSLPFPPRLIAFSKDLVVFWTPGCALIELSIQRLLESANLSPQPCSLEARLVLQNSFNRVVRTGFAALHPFAQNSIDLFRREKPERIVARRTGPTICHWTKHRVDFARRTGCFGECSTLVNHEYFQQRASRGGVLPGLAAKLPWATSPQSPALDRPSSLLGKAASVGGPHTVLHRRTSGELLYLWSEHRPAEDKTLERPE